MTPPTSGRVVGRFVVPAQHPGLPGHFPGQPVVPGVVLLDHVLELTLPPGVQAAALTGVKFLAAVLPDQTIEVTAAAPRAGRIGFAATCGGRTVLRGTVAVANVSWAT